MTQDVSAGRLYMDAYVDTAGVTRGLQARIDAETKTIRAKIRAEIDARAVVAETKAAAIAAGKVSPVKVTTQVNAATLVAQVKAACVAASAQAVVKVRTEVDNRAVAAASAASSRVDRMRKYATGGAASVKVEADTAAAAAEIEALRKAQEGRDINIPVKADTSGLLSAGTALMQLSKIPALAGGFYTLGAAIVSVGGGLVAMASAASQAVVTLAAIPNLIGVAAQGIGALLIGFSGVGDAVSALGEQQAQAGQAAEAAGQSAAQAAEQAHAQADAIRSATQAVAAAEHAAGEAHEEARKAQLAVNEARVQAKEDLEDLNRELIAAARNETASMNALQTARENLQDVMWDKSASDREKRDARQAVEDAKTDLADAKDYHEDTEKAADEANKKGVKNADIVVDARERARDAAYSASQADLALANAQHALQDAQRGTAEQAVATSAAVQKVATAMDNLSPAGQRFALFLDSLRPRWRAFKFAVQDALLPPIQRGITAALPLLDTLQVGLVDTAGRIGGLAERLGRLFGSESFNTDVTGIMASNNRALGSFSGAAYNLVEILRDLAVVAGPTLVEPFAKWVEALTAGWRESVNTARETGALEDKFRRAGRMANLLKDIIGNLASAIGGVGDAAAPSGTALLKSLERTTQGWADFANSDAGEKRMARFFEAVRPVTEEFGRLVTSLSEFIIKASEGGANGGLTTFLSTLTFLVDALNRLLDVPGAAPILGALMALAGVGGALGLVAGVILKMGRNIAKLGKVTGLGKLAGALFKTKEGADGAQKSLGGKFLSGVKKVGKSAVDGGKRLAGWGWGKFTTGALLARDALVKGAKAMYAWGVEVAKSAGKMIVATTKVVAHTVAILAQKVAAFAIATATRAWAVAQRLLNLAMRANPIGLIITLLVGFVALLVLLYKKNETFRKIVNKVWAVIKRAVADAWKKFIRPALDSFMDALVKVGEWASWLWKKIIKPYWAFIGSLIATGWKKIIKPALDKFIEVARDLGRWFVIMWERHVRPAWQKLRDAIVNAWRQHIRPALDALVKLVKTTIPNAFQTGVAAIKSVWDTLKEIARKPVEFMVNTVYTNGIKKMVDSLPGVPNLPSIHFAKGGVMPGYTPGKDVHQFWSPTAGGLALSGGESFMVPQWTKMVGRQGVELMNAAARRGKGALQAAMGLVGGGAPRGRRFARGGVLDDLGGLIGGAASGLKDKVIGGVGGIFNLAKGLAGKFGGWASTLKDKYGTWGSMMGQVLGSVKGKLVDWVQGKVKSMFTTVGGGGPSGAGTPNGNGGLGPAAIAASNFVRSAFGFTGTIGGYANRNIAGTSTLSKHALGKAIDVMVYSNKALGDRIAGYFASPEGRTRFGVDNVIWNRMITNAGRGWQWGYYDGVSPHTDHPHIDFYDRGGPLYPGSTLAVNKSGKTETVFTNENMVSMTRNLARIAQTLLVGIETTGGGNGDGALFGGDLVLQARPDQMPSMFADANYEVRRMRRGGVHARRTT